jgi:hypothetical protein
MIMAYAIVGMGLPMLAAKIIWLVPGAISTRMLSQVALRLDEVTDAVIEGFLALQLAAVAFDRMGIQIIWKVPLTLILVTFLWNRITDQSFKTWPAATGILIGFASYPKVSLFLSLPLTLPPWIQQWSLS